MISWQSELLLNYEHKESWYQIHVYGLVPERFQCEMLKLMKSYKFALPLTANEKERQFLIQLSYRKSLEDAAPLVNNIPLVPPSGSFTFFSIALTKA